MKKHTFIQYLTNHASVIVQKYSALDEIRKESNLKDNYTPKESYVVESLLSLGEVETVYQQLEQSPYFLANFRSSKILKEKGITRFDHIIYHIESHLFRATGIFDRLLIHVNVVFKFGLLPEDCKSHNILINKKGKEGRYCPQIRGEDIELYSRLLDLMNLVNTYRNLRNEISHQKRYESGTLRDVEIYNVLQTTEPSHHGFDINRYAAFIKTRFDKTADFYKKEMLGFNDKVRKLLDIIYSRLQMKWDNEYKK